MADAQATAQYPTQDPGAKPSSVPVCKAVLAGAGVVQFDHASELQEADRQVAVHVREVRRQLCHDQGIRLRGDLHRRLPGAERHQGGKLLIPRGPFRRVQHVAEGERVRGGDLFSAHLMAASELSGSAARSRRQGLGSATELRWLYDRHSVEEARGDLARWLLRWQERHPKLCAWVEANIDETFAFYRLPREHHKHLKSTNMLERLNQEFKRRTHIVRIFTDEPCCLRLIRALAVETHEEWIDASRYLNMAPLRELLKKPAPERQAA